MNHVFAITRSRECGHWTVWCMCIGLVVVIFAMFGCDQQSEPTSSSDTDGRTRLVVSVAASMGDAMEAVVDAYRVDAPSTTIDLNLNSTGLLVSQIEHGAPVDVLISADPAWVDRLMEEGHAQPIDRTVIAGNAMALIVPARRESTIASLDDLAQPDVKLVAIGDPQIAPVGRFARDLLIDQGLWQRIETKVVYGTHARQVMTYVERGEVDAALVYATDTMGSPQFVRTVATATLPDRNYEVVTLTNATDATGARAFVDFLTGPQGQRILKGRGFLVE